MNFWILDTKQCTYKVNDLNQVAGQTLALVARARDTWRGPTHHFRLGSRPYLFDRNLHHPFFLFFFHLPPSPIVFLLRISTTTTSRRRTLPPSSR